MISSNIEKNHENNNFTILKTDSDKRLVFGWASIIIKVDGEVLEDRQHDMIDPEDLEEAAYEYVLNFRDTGEEHLPGYRKKGKLIESCVLTKEKQRAMGIPEGVLPVGWWIGFYIEDDDAWERVKNGTYRMFSIEGKAQREEVQKSADGVGVLVVRDGKILTGTRTDPETRGQICGPGGHIEPGETPEEAAIREAYEEFGIICRDLVPCGEDGRQFMCVDFTGTPKADEDEMTDAKWRTSKELAQENLFPAFEASLKYLPQRTAKSFGTILKGLEKIEKFNPHHDELGRFSTRDGATFFTIRTKDPSKQHWAQMAIDREKEYDKDQKAKEVKVNFTPAKTKKEAIAYAKQNLGFKKVSYGSKMDLETINSINETVTHIQAKYPELKGAVTTLKTTTKKHVYAFAQYDGFSGEMALAIGSNLYGKGVEHLKKSYENDVKSGFHPQGTDYKSIIWHEYGHMAEYLTANKNNNVTAASFSDASQNGKIHNAIMAIKSGSMSREAIKKAMNKLGLNSDSPSEFKKFQGSISKYASKNTKETFAEAFAEYNCSKNPRPEAKAIVEAAGWTGGK